MNDKLRQELVKKCKLTDGEIQELLDRWASIDMACMAGGTDRPSIEDNINDACQKVLTKALSIIASEIKHMELPKCSVEYNPMACGAEDDTDNCYRGGWDESQQAMLKAVKDLLKED